MSLRARAALGALVLGLLAVVAPGAGQPVSAATPAPLPAVDGGTIATTLVPAANAFPAGAGDLRLVSRDCGHSVEVPGARSLWLFCDTAVYDGITGTGTDLDARVGFVPSGTAGLARVVTDPTPSAPVRLTEAAYPALPQAFIASGGRHGTDKRTITCSGGKVFAWTKSLVALPGTSTVVAVYQDHCPDLASGFAPYDIGVGELTLPDVATGDVSGGATLRVTRQTESVQVNPTPGQPMATAYAHGAVIDGAYLYLYGVRPAVIDCSSGTCRTVTPGGVELARVTWADGGYRTASKYRYYTGRAASPWSAIESEAVDILPDESTPAGDGLAVAWQPEIGRYVMIHSDTAIGSGVGPDIRTAPTPWGPWSGTVQVAPSATSAAGYPTVGCGRPASCRTYHLHPELSGSDDLWFSYVREGDLARADGQLVTVEGDTSMTVRLGSVPFAGLPAPTAPAGEVVPGRPTGVTATAGDGRATVRWTAPTAIPGTTIVGYRVTPYVGTRALDPVAVSGTATTTTVVGLTNTQAHTFAVTAVSVRGAGAASTRSAAVTPIGTPRAPTAITATPGDGAATVSWTAPTNTGGAPITGYRVTPYVGGVARTPRVLSSTATSKVIGELENGAAHTFTVQAVTSLGTSAASSASAPVTPFGVPGAPTITGATPRDGSVALTWAVPASDGGSPVTGYRVTPYIGTAAQPATVLSTPVRAATITGLRNGSTYGFRVAAVNARGTGAQSATSTTVTPRTTASAPTGLAVVPGDRQVTVSWVAPTDTGGTPITGYRVTPFTDGVAQATREYGSTATRQVVTGLANGVHHRFVVRAVTAAGGGAGSDFSPDVVPRTIPGAPSGVQAVAGDRQVTLSFVAPAADGGAAVTGYRITPMAGSTALASRDVSFATTHVVAGLANGTTYTFRVQALNAAGAGPATTSGAARPRTIPGAPGRATATAGNRSATVTWTAPASDGGAPITAYAVTPWAGGDALTTRTFAGTARTGVVTGLANGTGYRFTVRALNEAGSGPSTPFTDPVTPVSTATTSPVPYATWTAMVDGLHRAVLGRAPTTAERLRWEGPLATGEATPGTLIAALRATADQVAVVDPVTRLYRAYFLRSPDLTGLDFWVAQRRSGRSLASISESFARSAEFTARYGALDHGQFLDLVYRQVLGREPDQTGYRYWLDELRSGRRTRGSVMVGFSEAPEYRTTYGPAVEAAVGHLRLLGRAPTRSELDTWVALRRAGASAVVLYDGLVASTEHAARL